MNPLATLHHHPRSAETHSNSWKPLEASRPNHQIRFNTHSPAASAANAGGFLQTSLSEV